MMIAIALLIGFTIAIVQSVRFCKREKADNRKYKIEKAKRVLWWSNFMEERAVREREIDKMMRR